jgi:hypothetical protein
MDRAKVDPNYFWQLIETCPTGERVQLLNRAGWDQLDATFTRARAALKKARGQA